ncbi:hypothetical protein V1514DRAFT_318174 [Lipomyces japonicus]|uniref:uncharacterized protein n=1 Tax=Lipomyces japonicus TaxID=56871 RepID=UPI0034D0000C
MSLDESSASTYVTLDSYPTHIRHAWKKCESTEDVQRAFDVPDLAIESGPGSFHERLAFFCNCQFVSILYEIIPGDITLVKDLEDLKHKRPDDAVFTTFIRALPVRRRVSHH